MKSNQGPRIRCVNLIVGNLELISIKIIFYSLIHQRLVYAGKLLEDRSILGEVLRLDDEVSSYTVHLVCRQASFPKPTVTATAEGQRRRATEATTVSAPSTDVNEQSAPAAAAAAASYPGYDLASWAAAMQQHISGMPSNSLPGEEMEMTSQQQEQTMWMQHMYAQYMAHYMQYVQSAAMGTAYPQAAAAFMPQPGAPIPGAPATSPTAAQQPAPDNQHQPAVIQVNLFIIIIFVEIFSWSHRVKAVLFDW